MILACYQNNLIIVASVVGGGERFIFCDVSFQPAGGGDDSCLKVKCEGPTWETLFRGGCVYEQ